LDTKVSRSRVSVRIRVCVKNRVRFSFSGVTVVFGFDVTGQKRN